MDHLFLAGLRDTYFLISLAISVKATAGALQMHSFYGPPKKHAAPYKVYPRQWIKDISLGVGSVVDFLQVDFTNHNLFT